MPARLESIMRVEHGGAAPRVDPDAWVAPDATLVGDIMVGPGSRVLWGAVLVADGGPIRIGAESIVMERALIRASKRHPVEIGNNTLIGPHAYITGATICDRVFIATGASVFNGAEVASGAEVRINGVVHLKTRLAAGAVVPIGWIAVGDPARILPPDRHEEIWAVQKPLNFPKTVFGVDRNEDPGRMMVEVTRRYARFLGSHEDDRIIEE